MRSVIATALSGDTVSMTTLACKITLDANSGAIPIAQDITLEGSGYANLAIVGNGAQVFVGSTTGTVTINHLSVYDGKATATTGTVTGGCIQMAGSISMRGVLVSRCSAENSGGSARGGAIYTPGTATLFADYIGDSHAIASGDAQGGGVFAQNLNITYSTISHDYAFDTTYDESARGGGAFVTGSLISNSSTFDTNTAGDGGGIAHFVYTSANTATTTIVESTISGNVGTNRSAGISHYCFGCTTPDIKIYNSTFAFNQAGLNAGGIVADANIIAHSSIFANNRGGTGDVYLFTALGPYTFTGTNNLLINANVVPGTGAVTVTSDPRLTPLALHGAPNVIRARTHGLSLNSPAIGIGDNLKNYVDDERGNQNGGFLRTDPAGHVDIGAFERQVNDDELFYGGFN